MIEYRKDIDGIRAIAVLSVVIYHLNPAWLPGGFLGVDIFFVVSGFLITSIIYPEIQSKSFSFLVFYNRRIKRIIPALYLVTIVSLAVGYLILLPENYIELARSALAAMTFSSNLYFAFQPDGYFGINFNLPLLHTWSLSVEEQYYLLWPVILTLLFRFRLKKTNLLILLGSLAAISFISATAIAVSDNVSSPFNYYSLSSRAGELLIGSMLAMLPGTLYSRVGQRYWSIIGLILIAAGFILIDKDSIFPGINALWPCLGTAMIIANRPDNSINTLLSTRPFRYVGLISYSLYLWHWPVIAFLRYSIPENQTDHPLSLLQISVALLLIWCLSHLTYVLIEKTGRAANISFKKVIATYLILPSAFITSASFAVTTDNGIPQRFGQFTQSQTSISFKPPCTEEEGKRCVYRTKEDRVRVAIIGDSHGKFLKPFFLALGYENNFSIDEYTANRCSPAAPAIRAMSTKRCLSLRKKLRQKIKHYDAAILVSRWEMNFFTTYDNTKRWPIGPVTRYREKLIAEIQWLQAQGIDKVILIQQVPKYKQDIKKFLIGFSPIHYELDQLYILSNREIKSIANDTEALTFNFESVLCPEKDCSPFDKQGRPVYFDDDHLSVYGAEWLYHQFSQTPEYADLVNFIRNRSDLKPSIRQ